MRRIKVNKEQVGLVLLGMGLGMIIQKGIVIGKHLLQKQIVNNMVDELDEKRQDQPTTNDPIEGSKSVYIKE